jgi:hypothetical protein
MDGSLDAASLVALVVAAVALLAVAVLGRLLVRERRRAAEALRAVAAGQAELRALVEERMPDRSADPSDDMAAQVGHAEFLITDVGRAHAGLDDRVAPGRVVPDGIVLSAALGEPLVRAAALGHGLRRALSAESRNRIRFAMRREVRRSRKQRKQEMKEAWRRVRAEDAGSAA